MKNALFSTVVDGFEWKKWATWLRPRKDGEAREYSAMVESSVIPDNHTKLLVLYPSAETSASEKKNRKSIRKCTELLIKTHRSVRHDDGSVGKMVGAGEHQAYTGLVEVRCGSPTPFSLPHPIPHPTLRSPSRPRSSYRASASVVGRTTWRAP